MSFAKSLSLFMLAFSSIYCFNPAKAEVDKKSVAMTATYSIQCMSWQDCVIHFEDNLMIVEVKKPPVGDRRLGAYNVLAIDGVANTADGTIIPIAFSNIKKISPQACTSSIDEWSPFAGKVGDCSEVATILRINIGNQTLIPATKYSPNRIKKWGNNWTLTLYMPNDSSTMKFTSDFEKFLDTGKRSLLQEQSTSPGY